jgi:hypothetical protein
MHPSGAVLRRLFRETPVVIPLALSSCALLLSAPVPLPDQAKKPSLPPDGVYSRVYWQPSAALHRGSRHFVFRDGKALAEAMGITGSAADETATAKIAELLGVKTIDWQKQMVVTVAAGLRGADVDRLTISRAVVKDDVLTLYYELRAEEFLKPPAEGAVQAPPKVGGFGYPAETALVPRIDGNVRLKDETPTKPASKE